MKPISGEMRGRFSAALGQLGAALSEQAGQQIEGPWLVIARAPATDAMTVFHHGIPDDQVVPVLKAAARVVAASRPDEEHA